MQFLKWSPIHNWIFQGNLLFIHYTRLTYHAYCHISWENTRKYRNGIRRISLNQWLYKKEWTLKGFYIHMKHTVLWHAHVVGFWKLYLHITMTLKWARWRLKSPTSRLFTQPYVQANIKENIKAPRHWPLCREFTGDRWIPRTNDQ